MDGVQGSRGQDVSLSFAVTTLDLHCTADARVASLTIVMKMPARGSSLISRPSNWNLAKSFFSASWICATSQGSTVDRLERLLHHSTRRENKLCPDACLREP